MHRLVTVAVRLAIGLLLASGMALVAFTVWLTWHYQYELDLPNRAKLAAISATDQLCSVGGNRTFVPLADIPPLVQNAFVALEEPGFHDRPPVLTEIASALLHNRRVPSAMISTHVTRCLMPPDCCKGLDRTIGTYILLNRVGNILPKNLVLEIYLNDVYLGRGANGVAAAASAYFGKSLGELSPGEIAFMITRARSPHPSQDGDSETRRRNFAIDRMLQAGVINSAEAVSAREPLFLRERPQSQ